MRSKEIQFYQQLSLLVRIRLIHQHTSSGKKVKDSSNVKLVKVTPKPTNVAEPTLLMINNFKIEIAAEVTSLKITKLISVDRENI